MKGQRLKALFGLAITVLLLWWALRDVSLAAAWRRALMADGGWLVAMVAVATLTFVPRASRWQVLLEPVRTRTGFDNRFGAVCIGAMANNLLPARLGEFARAYSLSRVEPVGTSAAFGSIVVERVFDGLVLAALLALALTVPGSPVADGGNGTVRQLAAGGAAVFGVAAVVLWLVARFPRRVLLVFEHTLGRILSPDLTDRGIEILASFIEGLGALHRPGVFLRTLAWTVVVWGVSAASIWCGYMAFDIHGPGVTGAVFVQALIGFAVAIPSSPGFFGPFEAAARFGLGLYGVDAVDIVSFAGTYHLLTFIPVTLIGLWYMRRIGLKREELVHSEEIVGAAVEEEEGEEGDPAAPGAPRRDPRPADRGSVGAEEPRG